MQLKAIYYSCRCGNGSYSLKKGYCSDYNGLFLRGVEFIYGYSIKVNECERRVRTAVLPPRGGTAVRNHGSPRIAKKGVDGFFLRLVRQEVHSVT